MTTQLAVLFGGRSVEHEISVITALQAIDALDPTRFSAIPVYISQNGRWYTGQQLLSRAFYRGLPDCLNQLDEVTVLAQPGIGGLTVLSPANSEPDSQGEALKAIPVDVYLLAFHGQYGEDGCIQGLLEMADATYTGCGVYSSAVAMDKFGCKAILRDQGIKVLPGALIERGDARKNIAECRAGIIKTPGLERYPLFIKPNHLGSSIGIGKASDAASLDAALANAFKYDTQAIVEPCLEHMFEINVSVADGDPPIASVVEIPVASDGALTYEDKYIRGGAKKTGDSSSGMANLTRVIDPQDLAQSLKDQVITSALKAFKILGCSGIGRFDFIVDKTTGQIFFNELNPIPGSLSFYLWVKSHPARLYTEMLSGMIERAQIRAGEKASLQRSIKFRALFKQN
jgi:D-alanine-D-alanine ligase